LSPLPLGAYIAIAFVAGAIFGSFGNVVIVRMPKGESVAFPGSRCRSCGASIRWWQNIPILSWLLLRGRCAKCGAPISARYPIVEATMGALFAAIAWRYGQSWAALEMAIFAFMLVCASAIDLDHMILPDKLTLPGLALGLLGALIVPGASRNIYEALAGALIGGGFLWAVAALYFWLRKREGMGGGDIKLLAWVGAVLGWKAIPMVVLFSSLGGSVVGIALSLRAKDAMQRPIPFGPYLAAAALAYALLDGPAWADWYLRLHGLD
jgi:leader peptidase (prepilin peptidase)/N-methyltransferase